MKLVDPLLIDENTQPSWETPEAKWYLIKKLNHYNVWRWDSKKDDRKAFLITDNATNNVVSDDHNLEAILTRAFFLNLAIEKSNQGGKQ